MSMLRIEMGRTPVVLAGLIVVLFAKSASAMTLEVGSASTTPGSVAEIAVRMQTNAGEKITAVQNDIVFDPSVVSIVQRDCRLNPSIDKTLNMRVTPNSITIIIIHLGNVDPIPVTDILYTCTFHVGPQAPDGNINLSITNVIGSTPSGGRIDGSGISGAIFVSSPAGGGSSGAQPQVAPAPARGAAPAPPPAILPGGAGVQPAAPAGAPPLPRAERAVEAAPALPAMDTGASPTAAAGKVRTGTAARATATPGKTTTPTPATPDPTATTGTPTPKTPHPTAIK